MSNTPASKTSNSNETQLTNPIIKVDDIMSTLAKESGWVSDVNQPLYHYQGFWYVGVHLRRLIAAQAQQVSEFNNLSSSHVIISSTPKSGTTWLQALVFAISTRTRFPIERFDHPLRSTNPQDLVPLVDHGRMQGDPDLHVFATHIPWTSLPGSVLASGCKIVYIWRDPKDVFVSLWHFSHKIRDNKDVTEPIPLEEAFDLFCRGVSVFGPFWDHVLGYWKAFVDHSDKFLFLKYEDVMNDVEGHVKSLAKFMGYPFSSVEEKEGVVERIVEMCSFESLNNVALKKIGSNQDSKWTISITHDAFFRKGKIGDWKNYLTEEMANKIDRITADKLGTQGLTF